MCIRDRSGTTFRVSRKSQVRQSIPRTALRSYPEDPFSRRAPPPVEECTLRSYPEDPFSRRAASHIVLWHSALQNGACGPTGEWVFRIGPECGSGYALTNLRFARNPESGPGHRTFSAPRPRDHSRSGHPCAPPSRSRAITPPAHRRPDHTKPRGARSTTKGITASQFANGASLS